MTDDTKENGKQVDSSVEKLELIRTLLDRAHAVVHCDARRAGVHLPAHLMGQSQVSLELSYEHDGALELTEELIEAALCFGEEYFECVVPLSAVWAVTDENNESKFWPEEMPKSVMIDMMKNVFGIGKEAAKEVAKGPATRGEKSSEELPEKSADTSEVADQGAKVHRVSHLRRVK